MFKKIYFSIGIGFLLSSNLLASPLQFDWPLLQKDLKEEIDRFEGSWRAQNYWTKFGCPGSYHVSLNGGITLVDTKFVVSEKNDSAKVTAYLNKAVGALKGDYRGASTLCFKVGVDFLIRAYDMVFVSDIYLTGTEENPTLKIVVRTTEFGRIELGRWVPDWVNQLVTSWVNRGLSYIWESVVGDIINNLVSKKLNHYLTVN